MKFGSVPVVEAEGAILAHSLRYGETRLKKGHHLTADDLVRLRAGGVEQVIVAQLSTGDVGEDEAAARLAAAVGGRLDQRTWIDPGQAFTGRVNLFAGANGVLTIDEARVREINRVDPALTLATLPPFATVRRGQMVATVKIIPFAVEERFLERCIAIAAEGPSLLSVQPFAGKRAFLIQTTLDSVKPSVLDKTTQITRRRLEQVSAHLVGEDRCGHETEAVARAILAAGDVDILLIAGASAITDPKDVLPAGIEAAGGEVIYLGMPVDPGNLLLLARRQNRPVIGLPGCARSPKLNGFDWVLARLAADLTIGPEDISAMGVGGLLTEIPSRPQPRSEKRGSSKNVAKHRIGAVVLAAGRSTRMGEQNKLLLPVAGKAMVEHAVDTVLDAGLKPVVVVTGHQSEAVHSHLAARPVRLVHNPDYAQGLSTSLKTGIAALPEDVDAALIVLGDMPRLTSGHLIRLMSAFAPDQGKKICVPTVDGKRGNPVLWDRTFFQDFQKLEGDVGARHLIGELADHVVEVPLDDDAALTDIDTPDAYRALAGMRA